MPGRRLPSLHAIRAFEAAARHGSMTAAANELNVTPGAISRHVRALEAQTETPLFLRRATGLELTSAGEELARSVGEALDRIAEAASGCAGTGRCPSACAATSRRASFCRDSRASTRR